MIDCLAHVCIAAKNLAASERFYCEALGLEKVFNFIREDAVIGFYLRVSDRTYIEVFAQQEVAAHAGHPIRHFCLAVADIDAVAAKLNAYGYPVGEKKLGADQSWQVWTTDPAGVRIEFHQYTERSSQFTGADCVLG
ncbi:MAG: VOC family protein [Kiritimatiellae bacterium]|nr:VOC family protein [Kiritimatiellia bacterium]